MIFKTDEFKNCTNCIHSKERKDKRFRFCTYHIETVPCTMRCIIYEDIDEPMLQNFNPIQLDQYKKRVNHLQKLYDMPEDFLRLHGFKSRQDVYKIPKTPINPNIF